MLLVVCACAACSNNDENEPETTTNTLTVDASAYENWVYVDMKSGKTQTVSMTGTDDESKVTIDWQFAIHRYTDIKTNGGAAINTQLTNLNSVTTVPAGEYTEDVEGTILYQFVMPPTDENYVSTHTNKTMVWTEGSAMDKTLKPTNHVFVLKCKDGTYAKLQFTDLTNAENVKGHITFTYEYPVK